MWNGRGTTRSAPRAEVLQRERIAAQVLGQKLQRYGAAQLQVLSAIDDAHTASADNAQHAVA